MGKEMSKILPGIYVGRLDNAQNDNDMMANCITHVLSVHEPVKQKLIKSHSYKYFEVNVKDDETALISKYFSKTNDFIHEARVMNGNVLIHCLAGVSRAPTIVLAYLMTVYDLSFQDAYSCLRCVRPNIKPNNGFLKQLAEFEESEKIPERDRLFNLFGVWKGIEEDQKIIKERLYQYQNQESDNYYINESTESGLTESLGSPFLQSYGSEGFFDQNPLGLPEEAADSSELELDNEMEQLDLARLDLSGPHRPPVHESEPEDDCDIPGSIPIGGVRTEATPILGTSTADFRGRAHSRASNLAADDQQQYSLARYGSTAPPASDSWH